MVRQVLIVDDLSEALDMLEHAVRDAFTDNLTKIVRADSVNSARARIAQQVFDLALVDLHLGDGHGGEVITELTRRQPLCLVVVATIFDDDDHLFKALQAGAQGYLLKDRTPAWLTAQLRGIDAGQPPLSPAIARRLIRHFQALPVAADSGRKADGESAADRASPGPEAKEPAGQSSAAYTSSRAAQPLSLYRSPQASADPLTPREREVLGLLAKGDHIATIAQALGISRYTVGDHVKNLYRKLNITSRAEAALEARERGLG